MSIKIKKMLKWIINPILPFSYFVYLIIKDSISDIYDMRTSSVLTKHIFPPLSFIFINKVLDLYNMKTLEKIISYFSIVIQYIWQIKRICNFSTKKVKSQIYAFVHSKNGMV